MARWLPMETVILRSFSGENISPDYRLDDSLFDFQFVGLNKGGARVDSSEIIKDLVKFTFDCP